MQRVPYRDQPKMVEYANIIRAKATNSDASFCPNTVANAAVISEEPGTTPNSTLTPLEIMVRDVKVQITIVSINTSKIP